MGLLLCSLQKLQCSGAGVAMGVEARRVQPVLSAAGKMKLRENAVVIDQNIVQVKKNLETTRTNVAMIQAEIDDLNRLEREHDDLRKKCDQYLHMSDEMIARNDKLFKELVDLASKLPKDRKTAGVDGGKAGSSTGTSEAEKTDRQRWEQDARGKIDRVKRLRISLDKSMNDIKEYREPLVQEIRVWKNRENSYLELIGSLEKRKAEYLRQAEIK